MWNILEPEATASTLPRKEQHKEKYVCNSRQSTFAFPLRPSGNYDAGRTTSFSCPSGLLDAVDKLLPGSNALLLVHKAVDAMSWQLAELWNRLTLFFKVLMNEPPRLGWQ
jgi:hypothetical protein